MWGGGRGGGEGRGGGAHAQFCWADVVKAVPALIYNGWA